ncbi:MAG: DUF4326 domain-containing protein [Patescibacteria group bacterium]|nr:DUF4326 domain-containing protein [Patescibacteria group bacterium]
MPKRIQLRRTKGWRLPEGAVNVARPTKWGNPFTLATGMQPGFPVRRLAADLFRLALMGEKSWPEGKSYPSIGEIREGLAGKDLACWCPLNQPCHADVLLKIANEARK